MNDVLMENSVDDAANRDIDPYRRGTVIRLEDYSDIGSTSSYRSGVRFTTATDSSYIGRPQRKIRDFRAKEITDRIRIKAESELIQAAYDAIIEAIDEEVDRIERSNYFDEWRDYMDSMSSDVLSFGTNHRKVLGAVLVAVNGRDLFDFSTVQMKVLKEATYTLKQLRVTRRDSKRIIQNIIDLDFGAIIPLGFQEVSNEEEEELEKIIDVLLQRSK